MKHLFHYYVGLLDLLRVREIGLCRFFHVACTRPAAVIGRTGTYLRDSSFPMGDT